MQEPGAPLPMAARRAFPFSRGIGPVQSLLFLRASLVLAALAAALAAGPAAAASGTLGVTAVVLSKSNCIFRTGALTLAFGNIDQTSGANAVQTTIGTFKCGGSATTATYSLELGNGLHSTGANARRMQNKALPTEYLPYSVSISPESGSVAKNQDVNFTVTGTIQPSQFQNVSAGDYEDTVVITLLP